MTFLLPYSSVFRIKKIEEEMHYEENTVAFRRSLSLLYKYMYIYMLLCFFLTCQIISLLPFVRETATVTASFATGFTTWKITSRLVVAQTELHEPRLDKIYAKSAGISVQHPCSLL